ncbi:MAG: ATP-binding protein [bacterium]|nr:ATP-binding protein [bacterium]
MEILDDGEGIPDDSIGKVFEPCNRAHNPAGQPSSVWLGLTVSRTLAELMGGTLDYEFTDGWICFRLRLPVAGAGSYRKSGQLSRPIAGSRP